MKQISPHSLFVEKPIHPGGLWSLWDMLNHWGYRYLVIGNALTHMEMSLEVHLGLIGDSEHDRRTSDIQPDEAGRGYLLAKCHEIESFLSDQDLGAIPGNLTAMMAKIMVARREKTPLYATDLLKDVEKLKNDFALILSNRFFYSLRPEFNGLYGKPALFGEKVAKKFPKASDDIEWAGKLLGSRSADRLRAAPGSRHGNRAPEAGGKTEDDSECEGPSSKTS